MKEWLELHKTKLVAGIGLIVVVLIFSHFRNSEGEYIMEQEVPLLPKEEVAASPEEEVNSLATIMVDVKGAVKVPGVYSAVEGERVIDLITKAGGFQPQADQNQVNLSERVADEMVIFVPIQGEVANSMVGGSIQAQAHNELVNINKASENELQTLPGIGPAKALAIIEYRETNSGFKTIEDIKKISGIGEKTFEKLESLITVK